jgi:L-lactate utilization protein LutC
MSPRDAFLRRVRDAVQEGNRAGAAPPAPARQRVGYQGAGADPVQRFCAELTAAGGRPHVAATREEAWRVVADVVAAHTVRRVVVGRGGVVERLDVTGRLRGVGLDVTTVDDSGILRDTFFQADLGISNVHRLIAETGTVVVASKPHDPRSLSLLPPVHIALADPSQILPDLFDLFDLFSPVDGSEPAIPPSCLSLITGPSKTGDIELRLVTGVHGPGEVHVVLCQF